jgi:hypothetical protein
MHPVRHALPAASAVTACNPIVWHAPPEDSGLLAEHLPPGARAHVTLGASGRNLVSLLHPAPQRAQQVSFAHLAPLIQQQMYVLPTTCLNLPTSQRLLMFLRLPSFESHGTVTMSLHDCNTPPFPFAVQPCGNSTVYCPEGSAAPTPVLAGSYSTPEAAEASLRNNSSLCPMGTYCLDGLKVRLAGRLSGRGPGQ